jgi:AcrR family transcriptional regulator
MDLLRHVVEAGQAKYLVAIEESGLGSDAPLKSTLDKLTSALASAALDTREFAILWQREARYLAAEDQLPLRLRLRNIASQIADRISQEDPGLPASVAELRSWAVLVILASPTRHQISLPRRDLHAFMKAACVAAIEAPSTTPLTPQPPGATDRSQISSRREELLAAAAGAFRRDGFSAVGTDDIGAEVGIVGPALYRYFDSKLAILIALCQRLDEWLNLETMRALRGSSDPQEMLRALVDGYTRVAIESPDLISAAIVESLHLPRAVADSLHRSRSDRESEWMRCLAQLRPNQSDIQLRIRIATAIGFINDTVRVRHIMNRFGIEQEIAEIAFAIMLNTQG